MLNWLKTLFKEFFMWKALPIDPPEAPKSSPTSLIPIDPHMDTTAPQNPIETAVAVATNPDSIRYPWDTPAHCYHNFRVLCDNAGLSVEEKNLLCECVYQESEFNNNAKCYNRDSSGNVLSVDVGLYQINSYYHCGVGKDFPSTDYVIAHPEEAGNWMIHMFKHGLLKQWVSYSSKAYLRWAATDSPMWSLGR